jgi:hypothetical protein
MGSTETVLPDKKFSGEEDIREFLRDLRGRKRVVGREGWPISGCIFD